MPVPLPPPPADVPMASTGLSEPGSVTTAWGVWIGTVTSGVGTSAGFGIGTTAGALAATISALRGASGSFGRPPPPPPGPGLGCWRKMKSSFSLISLAFWTT